MAAYSACTEAATVWSQPLVDWLVGSPDLCKVLAGLTLALELSAPAALVWHRARLLLIPALLLFQVGNALLLSQDFFFAYLGLYAFWLPWFRLRHVVLSSSTIPSSSPGRGRGGAVGSDVLDKGD